MSDSASGLLSRILSGSAVLFAGTLVHKLIAFVGSIFVARLLGDTGYGSVVVGLSVYFIASALMSLGLGTGIARNYPQADSERDQRSVLVAAYRMGLVAAAIGAGILFVAAGWVATTVFRDPSIVPVIRLFAVAIPAKVLLDLSNGGIQAVREPAIKTVITSVVQPLVRFSLIILLVLAGYGAVGVAGAYAVAVATGAIATLYFVHRHTNLFSRGVEVSPPYRALLSFSLPLVGSAILMKLMNNLDTLLIGVFRTAADVGQYNVAFILGMTTLLIYQSVGFMYVPELSELHAEGRLERANLVYRAMTKWVTLASAPFVLTALAYPEPILTFIYSTEYQRAVLPFTILVVGFFTHVLVGHNNNTLVAFGDTRTILGFDALTVATNVVLNVLLIPRIGIAGAAVATAFSYVLRNATLSWYLYRSYDLQPFSRWLFTPLAATVIAAVVLRIWFPVVAMPATLGYAFLLVVVTGLAYLSRGIEEADILLSTLLEENLGVDLSAIRRIHEALR